MSTASTNGSASSWALSLGAVCIVATAACGESSGTSSTFLGTIEGESSPVGTASEPGVSATSPGTTEGDPPATGTAPGTSATMATGSSMGAPFDGTLEIIVPPDENGALPPDLWVGCEYGPYFQVSDLNDIAPLQQDDPAGVWQAAQSFLSGGEGQFWPQEGWMVLRETQDAILLVARDGGAGVAFMDVIVHEGQWMWSGAQSGSECALHYVVPSEFNTVTWRLDPAAPPDAGSTALQVVVQETDCVSGMEIGDRLVGPQVVMTESTLRIAFAATRPNAQGFTCPGNPESPATVELPEPLGEREIVEGLAIGIDLEEYLP